MAWAMAVLAAGLAADAMAQTNDALPRPDFMHPPAYGIAPYFGPPGPDTQMPRLLSADPLNHWPSQPRERDVRYYGFSFMHSMIEGYAKQRNDVDPVTGRRRNR